MPEAGDREYPEHDARGCAGSPLPQIPAALPRAVSRGLVVGAPRRLSRSLPAFSFLGSSCFPGADGTETQAAFYSDLACPARPFPSRTNTHTHQRLEPRAVSTPSPWPVPPTQHLRGPDCSNLIHGISWKGEGKTAPGVTLPCPWHHPGARMALEAQSFLCIS